MTSLCKCESTKATTEGKQVTMWVVSDGRWQPEIRNMTAPRKSAYAEWTPSLEISGDLYGRGGRDTFASQTHHRERCPHHLHQQSVGISNLNQQFESAVDISRPQKQVTSDGMIAWTWTTCKWSRITQVKDWALHTMHPPLYRYIFIRNQLTSAANCDCSQCTYRRPTLTDSKHVRTSHSQWTQQNQLH